MPQLVINSFYNVTQFMLISHLISTIWISILDCTMPQGNEASQYFLCLKYSPSVFLLTVPQNAIYLLRFTAKAISKIS